MSKPRPPESTSIPAPLVSYREEAAGRETLDAISGDRYSPPLDPRSTKHYGDRISNAPGAVTPRLARALDTHPEIVVSFEAAGRATYAAIEQAEELDGPTIEITDSTGDAQLAALDIEQISTFVVKAELSLLESPLAQSELVRTRLLPFLHVSNPRDVTRIEVRPWHEAGQLLVRIWCRLP